MSFIVIVSFNYLSLYLDTGKKGNGWDMVTIRIGSKKLQFLNLMYVIYSFSGVYMESSSIRGLNIIWNPAASLLFNFTSLHRGFFYISLEKQQLYRGTSGTVCSSLPKKSVGREERV